MIAAAQREKLNSELKKRASEEADTLAPSNRLRETTLNPEDIPMMVDVPDRARAKPGGLKDGQELIPDSFRAFQTKGTKQRQAAADLAVVKLFCAAGLPTYLATYTEWHDLLTTLWPAYKPADRSILEVHLVTEAECVRKRTLDILRAEENLTVSYDGGTTRGNEAFWTIHVSTSDHHVYFLAGREATRESHTGQWIRNMVSMIVKEIGPTRFAAIVCDSTGSTRLARELLQSDLPLAFNVPDIYHHISNLIKNIVQIPYFQGVISIMRNVINKFHKSRIGTAELNLARKETGTKDCHGLEAISKTRFGTIIRAARSLYQCLPAIKKVVERGVFDLGDWAKCFPSKTNHTSSWFEITLGQLIDIGWPALKVLTCLEANDATAGDVCIYWHAFLREIDRVLRNPENTFDNDAVQEIYGFVNLHHNELFGDGCTSSSAELYYAGAYLDPAILRSNDDFFKSTDAPHSATQTVKVDYAGIRHPAVFRMVTMFLSQVTIKEIQIGSKPALTRWKNHASEFKIAFMNEMKRYARQQYPYNEPLEKDQPLMNWWNAIDGREFAVILPIIARKIFAVRVNLMSDERTVSTFTWITPACRAKLSIPMMTRMTQIRQFYKMDKLSSKHSCVPRLKYVEAAKVVDKASSSDPLQATGDDDGDDKWLENVQVTPSGTGRGEQAIRRDSHLEALETSYIDFNCALLSEILSEKTDDKKDSDIKSLTNSGIIPGSNSDDNDFTFVM